MHVPLAAGGDADLTVLHHFKTPSCQGLSFCSSLQRWWNKIWPQKLWVLLRPQICMCCWIHSSQQIPFLSVSPPVSAKMKQEHCFLGQCHFLVSQEPHNKPFQCAFLLQARALKGCRWMKGRRKAFLSDSTYSGLLFFSSSESEFWWWIQLLSPFRVVRTFICLMILLRSSSVGVITRSRRGRGKGRREEKGCWEGAKLQCQQVSCWQTLAESMGPLSEMQTLYESFATFYER